MVELRFRWPTAHLIHPNYFNYIKRMNACTWVPEFPPFEAESQNPLGTAFVNEAVVVTQMCDMLPTVPAGEVRAFVNEGFEVSWEKSDCGAFHNIIIRSNDEEE